MPATGLNAAPPAFTAVDRANQRLIGEISEFLVSCRLGVTPRNLLIAHSAFSGEDVALARVIGQRRLQGEPVSQEWLDAQAQCDDQEKAIRALIAQLGQSLDKFARTTSHARATTAANNAALIDQVARAAQVPDTLSVSDVVGLAQTVLDISRKLETDIRASEQETRTLRERLARSQRDAQIDLLTGLPNRRAFEAAFDRHYHEAQGANDHLCVAFCDIDRFKLINDRHGHEAGDRVLKAVAETLDRLSTANCHVARHGGEEFALLFRGLTKEQVHEKLDAVRENFAARRMVNRKTDKPVGQVTFSGGVADVFAYANPRDALRAADEALYGAKSQGRNTIMAAP